MTTEQAKALTETAVSHLISALENGQSEMLRDYLRLMARFHRYSWGNALLIYTQRPHATQVAGFHAWFKMRRYVRKGEKGIVILAPMVGRRNGENEPIENEPKRLVGFRAAHIFDISQTEGEPLPEFATVKGDPQDYTERLTQFVAGQGIGLEYDAKIAPAKGRSSGGKITLLPGLSPSEIFAVLVHEVAHELLHHGDRRARTTHAMRETEAEAVAFVVSSQIGLDVNTACSDYIQLHSGDKALLTESLAFVQQAASLILQKITVGPGGIHAPEA